MSDTNDLVRKLRDPSVFLVSRKDTADYIEELEAELDAANERNKELALELLAAHTQAQETKDKLAKAVEALGYYALNDDSRNHRPHHPRRTDRRQG